MIIIKNAEIYAPEYLGKKDICICNDKIEWIDDVIEIKRDACEVIDGSGKILIPGLIDLHSHITGGGGEGSFHTRAPRVQLSELIKGGVTTVMGLLGTDGITRSVEELLAHAKSLCEEGVTAYVFTGSYGYPSVNITGSVQKDIVFIQEVLGLKLAISDHRAPNIGVDELKRVASDVRVAGMVSGKPGVVVLHMGDDAKGLEPAFQALAETSIPIKTFRPTHMNRNPQLLEQGMRYLELGGYVDYTCGMQGEPTPGTCIAIAKERNLPTDHITFSSDAHGSWSKYDREGRLMEMGVSPVASVYEEVRQMVTSGEYEIAEAISFVTSNAAKSMDLYPCKGCIAEGSDADILLLDNMFRIQTYIAKGVPMMREGVLCKKGTYETD